MGDFRKNGEKRFGGHGGGFRRRDGGRGGFNRDRDRGPVTMHQATCDQCGKPCEVPFRPTSGKPVYCDTCFRGKKEIRDNRGRDRFSQGNYKSREVSGNDNEVKKQLEILNGKMNQLIRAIEAMANTKTIEKKVVKNKKVVKKKKN